MVIAYVWVRVRGTGGAWHALKSDLRPELFKVPQTQLVIRARCGLDFAMKNLIALEFQNTRPHTYECCWSCEKRLDKETE